MKLETERLILRQFQQSDTDAYAEMVGDPEVSRYLGDGKALNREDAWRQMATVLGHWILRGYGLWAVEEKSTGELLGRVGCWYPEGWPGFEIGWTLKRSAWGKGFATEAAHASVRYAFEELDQSQVISLIHPENARSMQVAERIGEKRSGTATVRGIEVLVFRLTRDEWKREG